MENESLNSQNRIMLIIAIFVMGGFGFRLYQIGTRSDIADRNVAHSPDNLTPNDPSATSSSEKPRKD